MPGRTTAHTIRALSAVAWLAALALTLTSRAAWLPLTLDVAVCGTLSYGLIAAVRAVLAVLPASLTAYLYGRLDGQDRGAPKLTAIRGGER